MVIYPPSQQQRAAAQQQIVPYQKNIGGRKLRASNQGGGNLAYLIGTINEEDVLIESGNGADPAGPQSPRISTSSQQQPHHFAKTRGSASHLHAR
jgi:hypothetical protein